jgi:hypothetical protein
VIAAGSFTSAGGVAVNSIARYTFGSPGPSITSQPQPVSVCHNGTAAFSVAASGTSLAYQWRFRDPNSGLIRTIHEGVNLDSVSTPPVPLFTATGAATPTINLAPGAGSGDRPWNFHTWTFDCYVTNGCGSATSNAATLTVCAGDFNCDSSVDFFDYLDFVDAFTSGAANADFNGDGSSDFFDYLDFVDAFTSGC